MAKRKSHRKAKHHFFGSSKRRNPFKKYRRHRRNPSFGGMSGTQIIELALGAAGGVIGAGYVTQLFLGSNNVGVVGYAGESAVTLAMAWAAQKFMGKADLAKGIIAGGLGGVIKRIWDDNVSGASTSMSGLGNRSFAGLGYYTSRNFPLPTSTYPGPGAALPAVASVPVSPNSAPQVVIPSQPVSPAGMGGSKRFGHRFN